MNLIQLIGIIGISTIIIIGISILISLLVQMRHEYDFETFKETFVDGIKIVAVFVGILAVIGSIFLFAAMILNVYTIVSLFTYIVIVSVTFGVGTIIIFIISMIEAY